MPATASATEKAHKQGLPGYAAHTDQGSQQMDLLDDLTKKMEELGASKASDLPEKYKAEIAGCAQEIAKVSNELRRDSAAIKRRLDAIDVTTGVDGPRSAIGNARAGQAFGAFVKCISQKDFAAWKQEFPEFAPRDVATIDPASGPAGGYLVPETLLPGIVRNVERYGVFESDAEIYTLQSQGGSIIKRASGMTCSYPDLAATAAETTPTISKVNVNLTTYSTYSLVDRFMLQDQLRIQLTNFLMQEIALAFAFSQDQNAFIGDGTSTYAGVSGLLRSGSTHIAASANDVTADTGDDTYAEVIAATTKYLAKVLGAVPAWVIQMGRAAWYMHSSVFFSYLGQRDTQNRPIADVFNTAGGALNFRLMNFPVRLTQVAHALTATAVSKPLAVFGDLKAGMGLARSIQGMELLVSEHARMLQNQIVYIANMRQDIKPVDTTAYARLITAAS